MVERPFTSSLCTDPVFRKMCPDTYLRVRLSCSPNDYGRSNYPGVPPVSSVGPHGWRFVGIGSFHLRDNLEANFLWLCSQKFRRPCLCPACERERITLKAGNVVLFPHGDAHSLETGQSAKSVDMAKEIARLVTQGIALTRKLQSSDSFTGTVSWADAERMGNAAQRDDKVVVGATRGAGYRVWAITTPVRTATIAIAAYMANCRIRSTATDFWGLSSVLTCPMKR